MSEANICDNPYDTERQIEMSSIEDKNVNTGDGDNGVVSGGGDSAVRSKTTDPKTSSDTKMSKGNINPGILAAFEAADADADAALIVASTPLRVKQKKKLHNKKTGEMKLEENNTSTIVETNPLDQQQNKRHKRNSTDLPEDWTKEMSNGKKYYANRKTQESSWTPPPGSTGGSVKGTTDLGSTRNPLNKEKQKRRKTKKKKKKDIIK